MRLSKSKILRSAENGSCLVHKVVLRGGKPNFLTRSRMWREFWGGPDLVQGAKAQLLNGAGLPGRQLRAEGDVPSFQAAQRGSHNHSLPLERFPCRASHDLLIYSHHI